MEYNSESKISTGLSSLPLYISLPPVITTTSLRMTNSTLSKLIGKVSYKDHKRTQQEVSDTFLHYLYNTYIVCAHDK